MKKLLGAALAAVLMFPVGSANAAELLKNLKVSGNLDVQMNSARNVTNFTTGTQDRISNAGMRTMLHADWDLLDDVHGNVTLRKNDTQWGSGASGGQAATGGSQQISGAAGTGVLGNVFIDRASFAIDQLMGRFDATVGRQWYGEPGDLIWYVGPRDTQSQDVQSVDAVRVKSENDWVMFDGLAGVMAGSTIGGPDTHTNIKGANVWWKGLPLKVNTFLWNRTIQAGGASGSLTGKNDNLYVYGVKLRGEAAGGWVNLDLAKNTGECRAASNGAGTNRCGLATAAGTEIQASNYTGAAALLELGFNADLANVGGISPWASAGWGSGRSDQGSGTNDAFQAIGSDWRPGVINRRFNAAGTGAGGGDVLGGAAGGVSTTGLSNRVVWGLGLNFTPAAWDQLTAGVQLWDFRLQRNDVQNVATPAAAVGNKHLGTEVALTTTWRHSENVSVGAGWARYYTGGFIKEQVATDNSASMLYSDISVRF